MTLQTHVSPEYRFFNGQSEFYQFGDAGDTRPQRPRADGRTSRQHHDAGAKIIPSSTTSGGSRSIRPPGGCCRSRSASSSRRATSRRRSRKAPRRWAGRTAATSFAETERYMGVFHEVAPKEQALGCTSCHGGTRWTSPPSATRRRPPATASRSAGVPRKRRGSFTKIHEKHVSDKGRLQQLPHVLEGAVGTDGKK